MVGVPGAEAAPGGCERLQKLARAAAAAGAATVLLQAAGRCSAAASGEGWPWGVRVELRLPRLTLTAAPEAGALLAELAIKLGLNALTTGGHVLKGKIMSNRMVDLQVSNNKLFHRAVGIVEKFSGASARVAQRSVIRSAHRLDDPAAVEAAEVSAHVRAAADAVTHGHRVVPAAIVLAAKPALSIAAAAALLEAHPQVRAALASLAAA